MRLGTAFALVGALLLAANDVWADTCTTTRQRREFRQLSHAERLTFLNSIKTLQEGPRPNRYDQYVQLYASKFLNSQYSAQFLPWHRAYLFEVEKVLQTIDPSITIPYWDWAYDYEAPHTSLLLSSAYFGGNGDHSHDNCVVDGVFADWKPNSDNDCIVRTYDGGDHINPWWSWDDLRKLPLSQSGYVQFSDTTQSGYVYLPRAIGGQLATTRAPDDPLFFLIYAFVDKLWADWQKMSEGNANAYSGRNFDQTSAKKTDTLFYDYHVEDVMDTRSLCYDYVDYNGE
ncbi:hypothetical protein THASP1DRAFT_32954, partial [Thamnocephalis sphaerospora]